MNTEQLHYLVSVARYRSFTETTRKFYMTQPVMAHQIFTLEREMGARLLLCTTRDVSFTRAGEHFLKDTKRILDQEEQALGRLRQLESSGYQELYIGHLNSPSRHFSPRLIAAYREAHPQVRTGLIRQDTTDIQTGIDTAVYDVSFSILSDLRGMNGYACRKLGADFYCLVCLREHPCLDNVVIDYAKLATELSICLSHTGGVYMYKQFLWVCRELDSTPASVTGHSALGDVIFTVECRQAIAIIPFRIREYMHTTGLVFVPLEEHGQTTELRVAWRELNDNPAVEWFTVIVNRWFLEHPELF